MTIRERIERQEHEILSPLASFADQSRGRANPEAERDSRTCFQRDTDRIIHSKAFRRLMHKTQVFLQPEGDHYRTRMTHTLEVSRIARAISVGLRLNEDLTEAIAMGHDLGHTPFGHAGEIALSEVTGKPFRHNEQSLRVVDILEKDGAGLNLTYETRMGILGHSWSADPPDFMEGHVIRFADRIAYINHDIDDAMRAGILCESDIPKEISGILGHSHSERINTLVEELITQTGISNTLRMRPKVAEAMDALRTFMFEKVYRNPVAKGEESKARDILKSLYEHYMRHPEQLPENFRPQLDFDGIERVVCDYIACMTDKYAIYQYEQIFIPSGWQMR
ncbi:MAG: deoxyguanosinetriphosphate triphosphohydrolase [Ruminococcaceae bacterium]|jgi:dGTPase|nr:deoxyguanosinetriphosphate triphosphohydrolase [Oscillospiraceae bacterium]